LCYQEINGIGPQGKPWIRNIDATGSKLIRNAAKVFLDNPNLVYSINASLDRPADTGQIRELFFLNQLQNAGLTPAFIKKGDMRCKGVSMGAAETFGKKLYGG
jgi:hypothetical protein